jgi:hypothetical protein
MLTLLTGAFSVFLLLPKVDVLGFVAVDGCPLYQTALGGAGSLLSVFMPRFFFGGMDCVCQCGIFFFFVDRFSEMVLQIAGM